MDPKSSVAILAAIFLVIAVGYAGRACAAPAEFQIPAGPASATLPQFANQSHMNILFASDRVAKQQTRAVSGTLEPMDALNRMLVGSGLRYQLQGPDSVVVSAPGREPSSTDGMCGHPEELEPCKIRHSQATEFASVVTVRGMLNDEPFDPGQMRVVVPDITLTRDDFLSAGFQTVGDALRSLPQNFGGGLNVGVLFTGATQATTSQSAASTVDLRGLGSGSTLVLVNGQRLAASEGSGAVDVTLIPISAVESINITTGSASALYGSDAVAGVVDIIIRNDLQGVEVSTALGTATEGSNGLQHYSAAAGHVGNVADVFAVADCAWQHEIESQQRDYVPADIAGTTLIPGMKRCSEVFSGTWRPSNDLEASLLGAFTRRSASQADSLTTTSPPSSTTVKTRADVDQYATHAVIKYHFRHSWTATLSSGLSVDDISGRELLTLSGVPDERQGYILNNRLLTGQIAASGTLAETRAGAVKLAAGGGYNQEDFLFTSLPGGEFTVAERRRIRFAFAETTIPLLASSYKGRDSTVLSVDGAIRIEQYGNADWMTSKKVALIYKPIPDIRVQASFGTAFRAPTLLQQFNTEQAVLEFVPDATQPSGYALALLRFGGNAMLRAETSKDAALELAYAPEALPGTSLQIGYFNISYRQRIEYPTLNTTDPLSDPNVAPFVIRNPGSGLITPTLAQSQFLDLTGGQFLATHANLLIDDRNQNFVRQKASGVDFLGKYKLETTFGKWDTSLNVAYLELQQQHTDEAALASVSGTVFYPPVWRGRFSLSWSKKRYLASLFANCTGGARVVSSPGQQLMAGEKLGPWVTLDGQVGMNFDKGPLGGHARLTLSVQNILDRHPPLFTVTQPGLAEVNYDSTNTSPVGRLIALQLTQTW